MVKIMKRGTQVLRVLIFEEKFEGKEMLAAQCLEKDICVQGKNLEELFKRLTATIYLEVPYMGNIPSAPNKFLEMWKNGEALAHQDFLEAPIEARKMAA